MSISLAPPPSTVREDCTVWDSTQRASWMDLSASSRKCWLLPRSTMEQAAPPAQPENRVT